MWQASGNQDIDWKQGHVSFRIIPPSSAIYFEAQLDDINYGDIALDNIKMKTSHCNMKKTWSNKRKTRKDVKKNLKEVKCGGEFYLNLNQVIVLTSPNYPNQYEKNIKCNYFLKSPENTVIATKFLDIDLEESSKDICIDGVEIRYYSLGQSGPVYVSKNKNFNIYYKI